MDPAIGNLPVPECIIIPFKIVTIAWLVTDKIKQQSVNLLFLQID